MLLIMFHPLHLATIHIYSDEECNIKATVKVFKDDLESGIYNSFNQNVIVSELNSNSKQLATKYMSNKLVCKAGDRLLRLRKDTLIIKNDVVLFHFTFIDTFTREFAVECNIFNELFPDQNNLLMVKIGEFEKGYRLTGTKKSIERLLARSF